MLDAEVAEVTSIAAASLAVLLGVAHFRIRRACARSEQLQRVATERAESLARSNEELERFAYVASHDLRSPLRGVKHLAKWITEDKESVLSEESLKYIGKMNQRIARMDRMLNDLLKFARAGEHAMTTFQINSAICEAVDLQRTTNYRILTDIEPAEVFSSRTALEQVIRNLIGNAIKHHDQEVGTIEVVGRSVEGGYRIQITDDGPGIAEEFHERIFDLFTTLKPRDEIEGSGMGLAYVQQLVTRYGNSLCIDSSVGKGTCMEFVWRDLSNSSDPSS
jgi:signal transduction histidine kinase